MEEIKQKLVDKSIEAFIMGLEIYNKPTIKYRIEGFSFFICNAWKLMLKAELLNRNEDIYYSDKSGRTLSLEPTIKKIYSDKNTRVRLNLEKIIELRNISTHFITEDYEAKYAPLFQACVLNFVNEIKRFHNIDISNYISQNFLTITANYEPLSNEQIRLKYPPEIAERFIQQSNQIDVLTQEYDSDKFAIPIKQNLYITKKKDEADFVIAMASESPNKVAIVKELKDPANTHKYAFNNVIAVVNNRLSKSNIKLGYKNGFNSYVLNLFIEFYDIKSVWKPPFVLADYYPWIFGVLLTLFLICVVAYVIKRMRNRQSILPFKKPEPKLPPHEQAIKELDEIKQQKLWQQGRSKEYYTLITDTLRRYIVDRFGINAMEMTSGEILDIIRKQQEATSVYESLKQIMQLADFVKFAKMNPLPDENDLSLMNAYLFINQTKVEEIPVPGEGEKAEGEVKSVEKNDSNISKE